MGKRCYLSANVEKYLKRILLSLAVSFYCLNSLAWEDDNAIGTWKSIDDDTGLPTAIVKTELVNGQLQGTVLKLIPVPGEELLTHCKLCTDSRKDQPIVGMIIMGGLHRDKPGHWSGGEILDPDEGKVYKANVSSEDGKRLVIRAYIGFSLLGRTQIWIREQ